MRNNVYGSNSDIEMNDNYELVSDTDEVDSSEECISDFEEENNEELEKQLIKIGKSLPLSYMKLIVNYMKNNPEHDYKTIHQKFKLLKSLHHFYRIQNYVKNEGTRAQKIARVSEYMYKIYRNVRQIKKKAVHDKDLRRWGLFRAKELNLDFKASHYFIAQFKKRYRISSRKIENVFSEKSLTEKPSIQSKIAEFRAEIIELSKNYNHDFIINSDQTGFEYE